MYINIVAKPAKGADTQVLATKIIVTKVNIMVCPANILANKRIINAKGLVKIPNISIKAINGFKITGTPGGHKRCDQ